MRRERLTKDPISKTTKRKRDRGGRQGASKKKKGRGVIEVGEARAQTSIEDRI